MMTRIKQWLAPPVFDNQKDNRTAYLLNIISFSYVIVLSIVATIGVLQGGIANIGNEIYIDLASRILLFLLPFIVAQLLMRQGKIKEAAYAYAILLWAAFVWDTWSHGGVEAASFSSFLLAIIIAGLLVGTRGTVILAGLSILVGFIELVMQNQGVLVYQEITTTERLAVITLNLVLSAVYLSLYIRSLDEALDEAEKANEQLAEAKNTLEIGVSERTQDLELAAEIGRNISRIRDINDLTTTAVSLIRQRFALYHVQLYLADSEQTTLTLLASTGEAGQQMLAAGHALTINTTSINSRAASQKQPIIVADTATNENFMPHPLLPNTRSETAVPLLIGENVVGVLDLQSNQPNAFTEENLPAFVTLAGQLAIAIENSTLFTEQKRTATMLAEEENRTRTILESIGTPLVIARVTDGVLIYLNEPTAQILDIPREELMGQTTPEFFQNPADRQIYVNKLRQDGQVNNYEVILKKGNGAPFWALLSGKIAQFQGELVTITSFIDITERQEAVAAVQANEYRYQQILDSLTQMVLVKGAESRIVWANKTFREFYGMSNEALREMIDAPFNEPDYTLQYIKDDAYVFETGQVLDIPEEIVTRYDGHQGIFHTVKSPIFNADNEVVLTVGISEEISQQKQAEAIMSKQAKDLQTVADLSTAVSTTLDTRQLLQEVVNRTKESFNLYHAHIYLLDEAHNMLQLAAGAGAIGANMVAAGHNIPYIHKYSLVAQTARSKQGIIVNNVFAEETFLPNPLLSDTKSEMAVPMMVSNKIIGVLDLQADRVDFFTDTDINIQTTLASQIAAALENARTYEQTREQAAIIENTSSIIVTVSMDQSLQYLNKAGLQRLGYSSINEVLGKNLSLLFPADGAEDHRIPVMRAVQQNGFWRGESALVTASGERFPVDQTITLVRDENGIPTTLIFDMTDITERKQTEKSVLENQILLRNIIDTSPDQIVVKSRENRFVLVNQAFANEVGKPVDDIIGKDDLEIGYDEEQVKGNPEKGIVGYWPEDQAVMLSGQTHVTETPNDHNLSAFSKVIKTPLKDKDGHTTGLVVFIQDISQQKTAAETQRKLAQELEQQLAQVNALQSAMTREGWRAFMTTTADKRPFQGFEFNDDGIKMLTTEDLHSKNTAAATGTKTAVEQVNPVKIQGTTIGKIGVRNANGEPLTEKQRDLFASLTDQVAVALDRARLFEETELGRQEIEEQAAELTTVNEISELVSSQLNLQSLVDAVGDRFIETFLADSVYIALVDEKAKTISFPYFTGRTEGPLNVSTRALDEQGGFTGRIYKTKQPVIHNSSDGDIAAAAVAQGAAVIDSSHDSNSYIGVPMIVGEKVIGVIGLNGQQDRRRYDEKDVPLLTTLASTIAVALQNTQQFEETQRRANRESLVNEISQKIQNATTIESAMQTAVTELGKALGVQRAVVELSANQSAKHKPTNGHQA